MPLKPVSRITETYQARDIWDLAWSCKQLCYLCLIGPRSLPGSAQLGGPQSSGGPEIHRARQHISIVALFRIKDLCSS